MRKIALMCDSAADVTLEEEKQLGIHVIRLPIYVEEKEYAEGVSLTHLDLEQLLEQGKVAKTSQPSPGQFIVFFDELLKTYDEIFYIPVSHSLSGTYSVAKQLSETDYAGKVTVVKSRFATRAIVDLLMDAKVLIEEGLDCKTIAEKIENEVRNDVFILPYDLHTLKRGGRISPAIAAFAGLLKVKVLLHFNNDGTIVKLDKTRTISKAYDLLVDYAKTENADHYHWGVLHASDEQQALIIKNLLKDRMHLELAVHQLLAIVRAHTGNKTIGVYRVSKLGG